MRQKKMIIAALAAMLLAIPAMVLCKQSEQVRAQSKKGEAAKAKTLEVSFDYQRQAGPGSNQYAVWIENEKGDVVKTVKADEKTDQQLDAVTGATPQAGGTQTFTWDFTDELGKTVPQGKYKVVVEATLFFDSDIIYSGTFSTKDKAGDIKLTSTLTKEDEQHKNMVTNVKAVLK